MDTDIHWMSAATLSSQFAARALSPVEVAQHILDRIDNANPALNAYCFLDEEETLRQAKESERRWWSGNMLSPLDGVPISIKDLVLTKGWPTLRGSKTIDPNQPWEVDGPPVARAREAGMVFLGKVTSPEFGWKASTDSPLTGITRNPWNLDRTPGGSSGGSSAAVAAGLGPLSIGSDGGGSIRVPASFTGTFGLKPTYGRVPGYPLSHTGRLAHYGPMARTVRDAAMLMNELVKPDVRDPHSLPFDSVNYVSALTGNLKGKRIAYSPRLGYVETVHSEVEASVRAAVDTLRDLGADIVEVDGIFEHPGVAFISLFYGGAAHLLADLPVEKLKLVEPALQEVVEQAKTLTRKDYMAALDHCNELTSTFRQFMESYDYLVTPTVAVPAFRAGVLRPVDEKGEELIDWTPFTYPFNMSQSPAASVCCGFTSDGLPIGLQFVGKHYADAEVLAAAYAYEQANPVYRLFPDEAGWRS